MSAHEIHHLLHQYGLGVVFAVVALQAVGAPLPGTTVLIAAALYAGTGQGLPIVGVIAAGALGALVGTSIGYVVGRWRGEVALVWLAARIRRGPERLAQLRTEVAVRGTTWLFIGRFVTGVRNVAGLVAGASGMSARRFLTVTAAAALTWALINGLEYYWFGHALEAADTWLQVLLVVVGIGWTVLTLRYLRRRALTRLENVPETGTG